MTNLSEYFWMDRAPSTNRKFRETAEATEGAIIVEIGPNPRDHSRKHNVGSVDFKSPDFFSG
jgi:hypothetical protein